MERVLLFSIRGGAFLILMMPLIVTKSTLYPFIDGKVLYVRAVTEIIFAVWLVLAYKYPAHRPRLSWLMVIFATYVGVALLSGFFGVSLQRSLWSTYERMQGVVDLAHWFILTLVMTSVFRSLVHWRSLLNFSLMVSVTVGLLGISEHYDFWVIPFYDLSHLQQSQARLDITLGNATYVGAYMMVNVLIGLGFLSNSFQTPLRQNVSPTLQKRRRRWKRRGQTKDHWLNLWRLFWITAVAIDFWVLWLTGTRGSMIGLSAGLLTFATGYLLWGKTRALRLASLTLLGSLVGLILLFIVVRDADFVTKLGESNVMVRRAVVTGLDDDSVKARMTSLSAGLKGFMAKPILGWGPENYEIAFERYYVPDPTMTGYQYHGGENPFDQAHNKPVEELTTKGTAGFITYVALWLSMALLLTRRVKREEHHQQLFTLFMGAALAAYFVQNLALFDTPAPFLQFILLLGFVVILETTMAKDITQPSGERIGGTRLTARSLQNIRTLLRRTMTRATAVVQRLDRYSTFFPTALQTCKISGLIVLALVSLSGVYLINYKAYQGATIVVETANPRISWELRLEHFERAIESFEPLANYPRTIMFKQIYDNWDVMMLSEKRAALELSEQEAIRAVSSEPQWHRTYLGMARLYQLAVSLNLAYLDQARLALEKATELAPETKVVQQLWDQQNTLENLYNDNTD